MLQSNSLFFRFRNRNGKRQAILTYVEACGNCRFERRSPPFFFLLLPLLLLKQSLDWCASALSLVLLCTQ